MITSLTAACMSCRGDTSARPEIPILDVDDPYESSTSTQIFNDQPIRVRSPRLSQGIIVPEEPDMEILTTESESTARRISSIYVDTSRLISSTTVNVDSTVEDQVSAAPALSTSDESVEISETTESSSVVITETSVMSSATFSSETPILRGDGDFDRDERTGEMCNQGKLPEGQRSIPTTCCILL